MAARRAGVITAITLCVATVWGGAGPAAGSGLMATGGLTSQPIGHFQFCKEMPSECAVRSRDAGPTRMTNALWEKIVAVNAAVNSAIKPMSDQEIYGRKEVWTYPVNGVGDCEDYVLEKRRRLNDAGISLSNLLITVVRKRDGEGHAVLTVRTDRGDLILDNLDEEVRLWSDTNYRYLKRQASHHTGRWVSLRDDNNLVVGSVRD